VCLSNNWTAIFLYNTPSGDVLQQPSFRNRIGYVNLLGRELTRNSPVSDRTPPSRSYYTAEVRVVSYLSCSEGTKSASPGRARTCNQAVKRRLLWAIPILMECNSSPSRYGKLYYTRRLTSISAIQVVSRDLIG